MLDLTHTDNTLLKEAFRFFCRHLVCLAGWAQRLDEQGNPKGDPGAFALSAFVLVIRGQWHLVTAGHAMEYIDEQVKAGKMKLLSSYLLAGFGPEVKSHQVAKAPIFFDYEAMHRGYIHQHGLDFALMDLGDYLRQHLEKNEIVPVREENWQVPLALKFDFCIMLGLPQEFVDIGEINPTMIPVEQLGELPSDIEQTPWPRFVGQLSQSFSLKSLVGMSGGPIYGFKRGTPIRYWIPAIQSGWLRDRKITFGCPVPLLAALADEAWKDDGSDE